MSQQSEDNRELPDRIAIPIIRGEMVKLRPARVEDLPYMEALNAYHNATSVTGKDRKAERLAVQAWVQRSVAWAQGRSSAEDGIKDPEARGTIAWTLLRMPDDDAETGAETAGGAAGDDDGDIIGMIFLIDIDGWARSARIQVILGEEYRGRGYSRDAMPRVMTYGFADTDEGLGLHRIWVGVPEKNTRSRSVYQSLGFVPSGISRDALWDNRNHKYQDLIVMDTLEDEYDPIRSLETFGMHFVPGNPGVDKALTMHEHSMAIRKHVLDGNPNVHAGATATAGFGTANAASATNATNDAATNAEAVAAAAAAISAIEDAAVREEEEALAEARQEATAASIAEAAKKERSGAETPVADDADAENSWPYNASSHASSKKAWWRTLGARRTEGRSRSMTEGD